MNLKLLEKMYFLGIGGIGMSALARYFLSEGVEIYGYDMAKTSLTKKLEAEGMHIHYDIDPSKIPEDIDMAVITPAIPRHQEELKWLEDNGYSIKKRAEVLGMISKNDHCIAVAGTHGKTTTSSLIAHILKFCGLDISAFLGGILVESNTNFLIGKSGILVTEADEYDRSFLHLYPDVLVILSLDADHLDIYGTHRNMIDAYEQLTSQIKEGGTLILMGELDKMFSEDWHKMIAKRGIKLIFLNREFSYANIKVENERYVFDFNSKDLNIENMTSQLPGEHNVSNTSVAIMIASLYKMDAEKISEAVTAFKGIKRRFEIVHDGKQTLIDDYAHHPEELRNAVKTAKILFPERKVLGIFQAHLYSRTKDFYKEFAEVLSELDEIWLMEIYPAREEPIEGVSAEMIFNLIKKDNKKIVHGSALINELRKRKDLDVLMTIGASDIDKYHEEIVKILK